MSPAREGRRTARRGVATVAGLLAGAVWIAGCSGRPSPSQTGGASGGSGGPAPRGSSPSKPPTPPVASAPPVPFRWEGDFPPDFAGFRDFDGWVELPSEVGFRDCAGHAAADASSLMPPVVWHSVGDQGIQSFDPRRGLAVGSQPSLLMEPVAGRPTPVLSMLIATKQADDHAYEVKVSVDLRSGRTLSVVVHRSPFSTTKLASCGFGIDPGSARALSTSLTRPSDGSTKKMLGYHDWEARTIHLGPFEDPQKLPDHYSPVGPAPGTRFTVGGYPTIRPQPDGPYVPLDANGATIRSTDLTIFGDTAVWVESIDSHHERIRSYTHARGAEVQIDPAPGLVRKAAFDGTRYAGISSDLSVDWDDTVANMRLFVKEPSSGEVRLSPVLVKRLSIASKLKMSGSWAVLQVENGYLDDGSPRPVTADKRLQVTVVVNLETWAAYRLPVDVGRRAHAHGFGTDGEYVYAVLSKEPGDWHAGDEVRRYPLARIAEWGLPWTGE